MDFLWQSFARLMLEDKDCKLLRQPSAACNIWLCNCVAAALDRVQPAKSFLNSQI